MTEVECVFCDGHACVGKVDKKLGFCPRTNAEKALEEAERIRTKDEQVRRLAQVAKSVETDGYRKWPRVRELIEFCKRMQIKKLGIAFCIGHDVLFSKFSEASVTTLVVKDRVTCHNPVAPLVTSYWRDTFIKES